METNTCPFFLFLFRFLLIIACFPFIFRCFCVSGGPWVVRGRNLRVDIKIIASSHWSFFFWLVIYIPFEANDFVSTAFFYIRTVSTTEQCPTQPRVILPLTFTHHFFIENSHRRKPNVSLTSACLIESKNKLGTASIKSLKIFRNF
jgi:hypothetical protein